MDEPVVAADGYTYKKSAIEAHLETTLASAVTKEELQNKTLLPNYSLTKGIDFAEKNLLRAVDQRTLNLKILVEALPQSLQFLLKRIQQINERKPLLQRLINEYEELKNLYSRLLQIKKELI